MKQALTVSVFLVILLRVVCFLFFGPQLVEGKQIEMTSSILDEPQVAFGTETFTVLYANAFGGVRVKVITKPSEQFSYGKMVKISGNLNMRVLRGNKSIPTLSSDRVSVLPSWQDKLMQFVIDIRHAIQFAFQKFLSTNSAALLFGIVLGGKGQFAPGFLSSVQSTGVAHIIAASGMNVTMVGVFFFAFFARFFRRQIAILLSGFSVGWYVLLSGLQPSILRAALMLFFSLTAQMAGRQYDGVYSLGLTAGIMLLVSPSLLFDVGFQLSVGATLGIIFIKPLFPSHPLIEDISTTMAAQLATLPILLAAFGQYGVSSVLVNALILWTVPFLMIIGGIGALVAVVLPTFAGMVLVVAAPLLWYMEIVIDFFAKHTGTLTTGAIPPLLVVGYYGVLGGLVWVWNMRKGQVSLPPLTLPQPEQ